MSSPSDFSGLAQQALALLAKNRQATLATWSLRCEGYPFTSLVNYAMLGKRPIFLMSSMAVHSKNIRSNPKASLLVTSGAGPAGPAVARVTVVGEVGPVEPQGDDELLGLQAAYLKANPESAQWMSFGDFQFFELLPVSCYIVAGFGSMGWVDWNAS